MERYPAIELAQAVEELPPEKRTDFVNLLPSDLAAEILEHLNPDVQYTVLDHLPQDVAASILQGMSGDVVVDLLLAIHPRQANELKDWLPDEYREQIDRLMTFPEDTAGSLATVDYVSVRASWTVERVLEHIRKVGQEAEVMNYVYLLNNRGQLVDVVSMREILLADPQEIVENIVNNRIISVRADTDQEETAQMLSKYEFAALPVVDDEHRIIGVVTFDDAMEVLHDETTEDIQKLGGSEPLVERYFDTSVFQLFRKRIGWLLILFVAEAYTGTVLRHFEGTLAKAISLTYFIPLLIGTGGNTGAQTVTTLVRALGVGEVEFEDIFRVWIREVSTGLMLGVAMGLTTYLRAFTLGVGWDIGPVVGIAASCIVVWASTVAAVLPLVLHKLDVDPAVVSGPFITTLVDGTGLIIYFKVAQLLLGI